MKLSLCLLASFAVFISPTLHAVPADSENKEAEIKASEELALKAAAEKAPVVKELPQRSRFQRVLRDYLATLTTEDFTIKDGSLSFDEGYLHDPDHLFFTWLVASDQQGRYTRGMFDLSPEAFTLKGIESADGIRLKASADLLPASLLFWADWNYPGNPFYQSTAIQNRVIAFCIVDMLMLEATHQSDSALANSVKRTDHLGGSTLWMAMTYAQLKDTLPPEVRAAYEEGLGNFVDRLIEWKPRGVLGNMECMGLVAMAYIAQSVENPELAAKAKTYAKMVVDKVVAPSGYVVDGGITDLSYNGLALYHVAWAARLSGWDFLDEATRRMLKFKSLLTFPDPDGNLWSPTHFTFRTSAGSANDQWGFLHREYGLAFGWPDLAGYLLFEGRRAKRPPEPDAAIRAWLERAIGGINRDFDKSRAAPPEETTLWAEAHFDSIRNWAADFYKPGDFALLRKWEADRPPLTYPPVLRSTGYFENLDDKVIIARYPGYAAVIYTGHIGAWGDRIVGFGGGNLSAFWTPETGSAILSRRRGYQHKNMDRLDEWRIWPVNALSGLTKEGKLFTSARVSKLDVAVNPEAEGGQLITVGGQIGNELSAPDGALKQPIDYRREFVTAADGIRVSTTLSGGGLSEVESLYEIIPAFIGDARFQPDVTISIFFTGADGEKAATYEPQTGITSVRIERFQGSVTIEFDSPHTVSLSPDFWYDTYQTRAQARNIMVHLDPTEKDKPQISYLVRPGK
jgi:hypothetical protein